MPCPKVCIRICRFQSCCLAWALICTRRRFFRVPTDWLKDVRTANEDSILELAGHLPGEAAEALINLATGVTPPAPPVVAAGTDPFAHPDAQRRFRVMSNVEELQRALDYPWEKWGIFLHAYGNVQSRSAPLASMAGPLDEHGAPRLPMPLIG